MEVAGLVFGALPVATQALKSYKNCESALDVVTRRKRHISKLLRILNELKCILDADIVSILRDAGIFEGHHHRSDIATLLQDPRTTESLSSYLGAGSFATFQNVIYDSQEVIEEIGRNVTGLLPRDILNGDHQEILQALSSRSAQDVKIQFSDGIKLVWRKADLEKSIQTLDSSIKRIHMLITAATRAPRIEQDPGQSGKLIKSLVRVRKVAGRLYDAFVLGWSSGCHPAHEAKLYLEHRLAPPCGQTPPLGFKVVLASNSSRGDFLWHESVVEVTDEEQGAHDYHRSLGGTSSLPKVAFAIPSPPSAPPSEQHAEAKSICLAIHMAQQEQKSVKFFLGPGDTKLRYCCYRHTTLRRSLQSTVSLKDILDASATAARSQRVSIKARVHLALVVASAMLQLSTTEWCGRAWSKENIYFTVCGNLAGDTRDRNAKPPDGSCNGSAPRLADNLGEVDLTRPLTSIVHDVTVPCAAAGGSKPQPKATLLELGIMFLEIWTEQTWEQYCVDRGQSTGTDYFARSALAQRWLDESEGALLPFQVDVVARCTKCFFDGVPLQPSWDDDRFVKSFFAGVVRPLYEQCK